MFQNESVNILVESIFDELIKIKQRMLCYVIQRKFTRNVLCSDFINLSLTCLYLYLSTSL